MFPSQLEYNSSLHPETAQMFQTITSTLNKIQAKLSTIQNQYTQQDAQLKKLENSLEKISDQGKGACVKAYCQVKKKSLWIECKLYIQCEQLLYNLAHACISGLRMQHPCNP